MTECMGIPGGQVPFIYQHDHKEVRLPSGYMCDISHVLAGVDAFNYPQIVTPLPGFLTFLAFLGPHVDSNMDVTTWLGDIASSSGDFLFRWLGNGKHPLSIEEEQKVINIDAPGSDMLGDIDSFVIAQSYDVSSSNGRRFTEIMEEYYANDEKISPYQANRFSIFCRAVGLKDWNGNSFSNEKAWLKFYKKQLRDNVAFQAFSLTDQKLRSLWLPLLIWFNCYQDVLKLELLLEIFLKQLKILLNTESGA